MSQAPIEDGVLQIAGNRFAFVGRWKEVGSAPRAEKIDLGDQIVLPGLINAHCHLDYTALAGMIPPPKTFPDWIKALLALKANWSYSEFAESWMRGAKMLVASGVTTVADIESVPELLPEIWQTTPARLFSFLEMTGVKSRRSAAEILEESLSKIDRLEPANGRVGLSPHAPYSTTPELLSLSAARARQKKLLVSTHLAESADELEMFVRRRGPLYDWLKSQRKMSDCGLGSPIQHVERHGLLAENLIATHVNYLCPGDAERLGRNRVSVAHCPRSHGYFQHQPFPRAALERAAVNICLGTDSLVTVKRVRGRSLDLNLFSEMRAMAAASPELSPETILRMATINGARALAMSGQIGVLQNEALADWIAIPFAGEMSGACAAVLAHRGPVAASMIDGQWAIPPASNRRFV